MGMGYLIGEKEWKLVDFTEKNKEKMRLKFVNSHFIFLLWVGAWHLLWPFQGNLASF